MGPSRTPAGARSSLGQADALDKPFARPARGSTAWGDRKPDFDDQSENFLEEGAEILRASARVSRPF